jgi:hypothetical protein
MLVSAHDRWLKLILVFAASLVLTGCMDLFTGWGNPREAWRNRVEAECNQTGELAAHAYLQPARGLKTPGSCGAQSPFSIVSARQSQVTFKPAAVMACPMAVTVDGWLAQDVQQIALFTFGEPVAHIDVAASYSCRTRNSKPGAKMSEHAYANALDIRGFQLVSGRRIDVESGWRGAPDEAQFLRATHRSACRYFKTVIGPDGDRHHRDHFHIDLAWHGKDRSYVYCK